MLDKELQKIAPRGAYWKAFVEGIETTLCMTDRRYPLSKNIDYSDWGARNLTIERTSIFVLSVIDKDSGKIVRPWYLTSGSTVNSSLRYVNPIKELFVNTIVAWAKEHDGEPLNLALSIKADLGLEVKTIAQLWDIAQSMSPEYASVIEKVFDKKLEDELEMRRIINHYMQ